MMATAQQATKLTTMANVRRATNLTMMASADDYNDNGATTAMTVAKATARPGNDNNDNDDGATGCKQQGLCRMTSTGNRLDDDCDSVADNDIDNNDDSTTGNDLDNDGFCRDGRQQ